MNTILFQQKKYQKGGTLTTTPPCRAKSILVSLALIVSLGALITGVAKFDAHMKAKAAKYAKAVRIVRNDTLLAMQKAQQDGDMTKLRYLRWCNENAERIVAESDLDEIINKKRRSY